MNGETVDLITRKYPDIVDDILTAMVGGVVNEAILFDVKTPLYPLSEPAAAIRTIRGKIKVGDQPQAHTFLADIDYTFLPERNGVVWPDGGAHPADDTTFYVDYLRTTGRSPLTDTNVGSVTRTLSEAIGREIATVYEQINEAYRAGFVDTATGRSLELVVSILDVHRKTGELAQGLVTFFRDPAVTGAIAIDQGTELSTTKGDVLFETEQPRTLQQGALRIDVPVRAREGFQGEKGKVDAGTITILTQTLAGIARVSNGEATVLGGPDETDDELRGRARAALRSSGMATIAALLKAVREERGEVVEIWDPSGPPDKRTETPGDVVVVVAASPERFAGIASAVDETRAAGVRATVVGRYVFFTPHVVGKVPASMPAAGKAKVVQEVIDALQKYADGLGAGEAAEGQKMFDAVKGVGGLSDPRFADVLTYRADVQRPGPEALVDALVAAVSAAGGDQKALRAGLEAAVTTASPTAPTEARIPDRSVLQGASGPATDDEITASKFKIVPPAGWWAFLLMGPADVVLNDA